MRQSLLCRNCIRYLAIIEIVDSHAIQIHCADTVIVRLVAAVLTGKQMYLFVAVCHEKLHKGLIAEKDFKKRKRKSTRDATFMGIMRKTLMQMLCSELPIPVVETRGYITKATREKLLVLPKSHTNDALAIAQGKHGFNVGYLPGILQIDKVYTIRPVRHHNRQLHKATILKGGIRKSNQAEKYVFGYRLFDKVQFNGQDCFIWGRRTTGIFTIKTINGEMIKDGISFKKLKLLEKSTSYLIA